MTIHDAMEAAGFELENTGGGIRVWRLRLGDHPDAPEFSLTDTEDTAYPPPALDQPVLVSVWDHSRSALAQWKAPTLRGFLESFFTSSQ